MKFLYEIVTFSDTFDMDLDIYVLFFQKFYIQIMAILMLMLFSYLTNKQKRKIWLFKVWYGQLRLQMRIPDLFSDFFYDLADFGQKNMKDACSSA